MALRQAVWKRLDSRFTPGQRILELNCGTGEDAVYLARRGVHVVATDVAPRMVDLTLRKAEQAGVRDRIMPRLLSLEELATYTLNTPETVRALTGCAAFDGALSNFGGLNCVGNLDGVAKGLASCLRPGAFAMLCVMGPCAPWEWAWYLLHAQPHKAFRRLTPGGVEWRGITIRYPTVLRLRRAFAPHFRIVRVSAIGALVPPSYVEDWIARRPRLLSLLNAWERRWETLPGLSSLADHYLVEMARLPTPAELR